MGGFRFPFFQSYVRWRHSRGFGVHSPFAYELVRLAIRPGYAYGSYAYDAIDYLCRSGEVESYPRLRKDARLLAGVLPFLKCRRLITCAPPSPEMWRLVAGEAGATCRPYDDKISFRPYDFLLATSATPRDVLSRTIAAGVPLLVIGSEAGLDAYLASRCTDGVLFAGKRLLLAVPRKDMAFVRYSMKM